MKSKIYSNSFKNSQIKKYISSINKYGYVKIENFLKEKNIEILRETINNIYKNNNKGTFKGIPKRDKEDKIIYNLYNKSLIFNDLLIDPLIIKIAKEKLNDRYYKFLPSNLPNFTVKFYNARSSGKKLDLHIDSYFPYKGDQTIMMQFAIVLENSYKENGCTVIVPKSHLSGNYSDRKTKNLKYLESKPGDLLIWDSRTWHGTTQNTLKKSRWAIIMTLGQWWIKPSMDAVRGIDPKIYSKLNNMQKQLLGFCSITPINENSRINTKMGYNHLKKQYKSYGFKN